MQHQFKNRDTFYFAELEMEDMETDVQNLNRKEAWQYSDFPTKIVKENFDIYIYILTFCAKSYNVIKFYLFPLYLKNADIIIIYKK